MRFYVAANLQLYCLFFKCVLILQVVPHWADNRKVAFLELVKNWVGDNPEFKAVSDRNKTNRGHGGTHCAGSSSTDRYRQRLVHIKMEQAAFICLVMLCITFVL